MDGYLLLARCPEDDLPIRLFRGEDEARAFLQPLHADRGRLASLVRPLASGVFALPPTSVLALDIVRIRDGVPEWVETALCLDEPVSL